jgi:4-amino-4-deoxychorismate lyase
MNTAPAIAWIDGLPAQNSLLHDRGLHYGDGLFETLRVRSGRIRFAALHANRLASGCERLGITCDAKAAIRTGLDGIDARDGTLKLIVTRGEAVARGYGVTGAERARVLRFWYPGEPPKRPETFRAVTLEQRWGENPSLAGMKHLNRLEQVLGRRELDTAGADEGLVGSSSGLAISGTMSNVFLCIDGRIVTPRVDRCGIAGVMRAVVLREAQALGIEVTQQDVPLTDARRATSVFFTNARIGLLAATHLDGRALVQQPDLVRLARTIEALDE